MTKDIFTPKWRGNKVTRLKLYSDDYEVLEGSLDTRGTVGVKAKIRLHTPLLSGTFLVLQVPCSLENCNCDAELVQINESGDE